VGAVSVPKSETILNGDVLTTGADGSALVELDSGARVKITENTSVRFVRDERSVQVQLQGGAVVSHTSSSPRLVVSTPQYQFAPSPSGDCRYLVRVSKDQVTTAAAIRGNVLIRASNTPGSYLLHEGNYAVIDGDASGTPSQPEPAGTKLQPTSGQSKHKGWRIGSLSQGESIALEVGIAGGAAAAIAIPLSRGGSASPSEP
jgi:ferric-dicitrate binding protein FerR (iron transport regulator)